MSKLPGLENDLRERRTRRGWSQDEVARRSGLSRAGVSAIEMGRLVPSTSAALALASAFGCRVEDLFRLPVPQGEPRTWAWAPRRAPCRYWRAEVSGRTRLYPVEATPLGVIPHDGVGPEDAREDQGGPDPSNTLVLASCDPAAALLAGELARATGVRLIVIPRSSTAALRLLQQGLIHAAGMHLAKAGEAEGNVATVRSQLGPGFALLHVARWEEGIAVAPAHRISSVRQAVRSSLRWIGREPGSGARQCLDELLGDRRPPRRIAADHRGVAESIRAGWADLGICLRLTCEEAGLDFLDVRREDYDLCFPESLQDDRRIRALVEAVRSPQYRRLLGDQPGFDTSDAGTLRHVNGS